jgi:hypothetical protein
VDIWKIYLLSVSNKLFHVRTICESVLNFAVLKYTKQRHYFKDQLVKYELNRYVIVGQHFP